MKYFFVAMVKKTQGESRPGRLEMESIFPLTTLLLASCSPAGLVSTSDSVTKLTIAPIKINN